MNMATTTTETSNKCPLALASILLNSKWDLIVVYNLLEGEKHFSELKDAISNGLPKPVTASSLSRILKRLEDENLVERVVDTSNRSVEITYTLTKKGKDLKPVISELKTWGTKHLIS